jgi:hypothetical protein
MDCDYTKLFYASKRESSSIKFFGFFHPFSVALWRSVLNPRTVIKCSFIKLIDKTSRKELKESFFSIIFFYFIIYIFYFLSSSQIQEILFFFFFFAWFLIAKYINIFSSNFFCCFFLCCSWWWQELNNTRKGKHLTTAQVSLLLNKRRKLEIFPFFLIFCFVYFLCTESAESIVFVISSQDSLLK